MFQSCHFKCTDLTGNSKTCFLSNDLYYLKNQHYISINLFYYLHDYMFMRHQIPEKKQANDKEIILSCYYNNAAYEGFVKLDSLIISPCAFSRLR